MKVLKQFTAVLLAAILILQIFIIPLEMHAEQNQMNEVSYTIEYMDQEISKGQSIPSNAELFVCFEDEYALDTLSESIQTVVLPEQLIAANDEPIIIMADKPNEEKSRVGVLEKIKEGYIAVWDEINDETNELIIDMKETETTGETETTEETGTTEEVGTAEEIGTAGETETAEEVGTNEVTVDVATGGSLEIIEPIKENWKLYFTIPVNFNKEYLLALEDNPMTLMSGGELVTINVFDAEIVGMSAFSTNKFEEAVKINHNTGTTSKPTGLYRANGEDLIKSDDIIYKNEPLLLRYNFNFDEEQFQAIHSGAPSKSYIIPVPDGLTALGGSFSQDINTTIVDEDGQLIGIYKLGEFKLQNNQLTFIFCGSYWDKFVADGLPQELNEIYIEFNVKLDDSTVVDQESYVIDVIGVGDCTIYIGDNMPTPHTLVKKGNDYKNDRFKWRLTYTPGSINVSSPVSIVDTFNTEQILIKDSFTINGMSVSASLFTITEDTSGTTIVYEVIDSNVGEAINIEYETTLSDDRVIADGEVAVGNDAYLIDSIGQKLNNSDVQATAKATKESKSFIVKDGETSADGRSIKWTIEIRTLDRRMDDLVMFDILPDGLELIENSITINGNNQSSGNWVLDTNPSSRPGYGTPTVAPGSKAFAIDIKRPANGVHESLYTVVYETTVSEDYYENGAGNIEFSNNAWLYFTWMGYDGVGYNTPYRSPEINKPVGIHANLLKKEGSYDKKTGLITWKVTVNPNRVYIKEGIITDLFDNTVTFANEHKYVVGSFQSVDSRVILSNVANDNELTVTIGEIGTDTAEFSFKTQIKKEHSHYNIVTADGEDYINKASFNGTVLSGGNSLGTPKTATGSVKATVNVDSKVIEKKGIGYDYSTKHITWEITVNHNLMEMKGTKLVDTIGEAQSYVVGSLKIDGITVSPDSYTIDSLTISIGDLVNKKAVITYETLIDVSSAAPNYNFYQDPSITMKNEVVLQRTDCLDATAEAGEQVLNNKILQKTGKLDSEEGYISYVVKINPFGIDISDKKIIDELPEGLRLDPDSVELYEADVLSDGEFQKKGSKIDNKLSYNPALGTVKADKFDITLPSSTTSSYVLLFDCYIVDYSKMPFKNKVVFDGNDIKGDENSNEHSAGVAGGSGGGSATSSKKAAIVINKVDSKRLGVKLEGVEFELYRNGTKIMDGKTDSKGKLTFYPLSRNQEYVLKEVVSGTDNPGYDKSTASILNSDGTATPFGVNNEHTFKLDKNGETAITITNEPQLGNLKFVKRSDKVTQESDAAGNYQDIAATNDYFAEFTITDKTPGASSSDNYIKKARTNANGEVLFENIPFGTYTVKETTKLPNHSPAANFDIVISPLDGSCDRGTTFYVDNMYFRPKLSITNINADDTNEVIIGSIYELYKKDGTKLETKESTNGTITFDTELLGGESYIVKQTKVPDNYYASDEYEFKVQSNNLPVYKWKNYPYATSVTVKKTDIRGEQIKLSGAKFKLWRGSTFETAVDVTAQITGLNELVTDANGKLLIEQIPLDLDVSQLKLGEEPVLKQTQYWLEETEAPIGYIKPTAKYSVQLTARKSSETIKIKNEPEKLPELKFTKYSNKDGVNTPLGGAGFTLTDNTANAPEVVIASAVSGEDGKVTFKNIPHGTYILKETVVPAGHLPMAPIEVIIDKSGTLTKFGTAAELANLKVINDVFTPDFVITKEDANGIKMGNVIFELYQDANGVETFVKRGMTDQNGILRFEKLQGSNTYVIKEIAPDGYYQPNNYRFTIDTDIQYSKTFVNYPIEGSISVLKLDALRNDLPLSDVEFGLYYATDLKNPIMTGKTGNDGMIKFEKVPLKYRQNDASGAIELYDTDYIILEQKAKTGYLKDSNGTAVKLTVSNQIKSIVVENEPIKGVVEFEKVNDWNRPLDNVEYELIDVTGSNRVVYTAKSKNGVVTFKDIPYGKYELVEKETIKYHEKDNNVYIVEMTTGGYNLYNASDNQLISDKKLVDIGEKGSITIAKYIKGSNKPLVNAVFDLVDQYGNVISTGTTDKNGQLVFEHLLLGEDYTIVEVVKNGQKKNPDQIISLPTIVIDPETGEETIVKEPSIVWEKTESSQSENSQSNDSSPSVSESSTPKPSGNGKVTIEVISTDENTEGYSVKVVGQDYNKHIAINKDGTISLSGIPKGEYTIDVLDRDGNIILSNKIVITDAGENLTIKADASTREDTGQELITEEKTEEDGRKEEINTENATAEKPEETENDIKNEKDESFIITEDEVPKVSMDDKNGDNKNNNKSPNNSSNQNSGNNGYSTANPRTSDNSIPNIVLLFVMLISLATAAIVLFSMKKEHRKNNK